MGKDVAIALLAGSVILLALAGCYKGTAYDEDIQRIYPYHQRVTCIDAGRGIVVCQ